MGQDFRSRIEGLSEAGRKLLEMRLSNRYHEPLERSVDTDETQASNLDAAAPRKLAFSISFFSSNSHVSTGMNRYDLLANVARFADQTGFRATWIPERHFQPFGGLFPNPSVVAAGLASITQNLLLCAGSVVLPLHDPLRIAEEWSVVDNISGGRVGIACASGWHPNDFVLAPDLFHSRRHVMYKRLDELRRLWQGESISRRNGEGREVEVRSHPKPLQKHLPIWITAQSEDSFKRAGELGVNVLTGLMEQDLETLATRVQSYRRALGRGHSAEQRGWVTLMLHTYLGANLSQTREQARVPLARYLNTFLRQSEAQLLANDATSSCVAALTENDRDALVDAAVERYLDENSLVGTVDSCAPLVRRLAECGVNEIACLVDFGFDDGTILQGMTLLQNLKESCEQR